MPHGRYESAHVRVVVRASGGGVMSADSKEPRLRPLAPDDAGAGVRRDTLRGVGDPAPKPSEQADGPRDVGEEEPRLRQVEFTVPPQIWRRPPSGWFRQFQRKPDPALGDSAPAELKSGATDVAGATTAELASPASPPAVVPTEPEPDVPSRSRRSWWLLVLACVLTALAFFGWRMFESSSIEGAPVRSTASADLPARVLPMTSGVFSATTPRPTESALAPSAERVAPPAPSAASPEAAKKPPHSVGPTPSAVPPPSAQNSSHGPIY